MSLRTQLAGMYESILVTRDGPVAVVTFNRPEILNTWDWTLAYELSHAYRSLDADDTVRAIVVTGAGRAFCAGAGLLPDGRTFDGTETPVAVQERFPGPLTRADELRTPVIAAVNGHAVGAGITMALEADIVFIAAEAKLGFVFNRRGVVPDGDLLWSLPRRIGFAKAMELLLTGRLFRGEEAAVLGLATKVLPAADVLETALATAHEISDNVAPVSAAITKTMMRSLLNEPDQAKAKANIWNVFQWVGQQRDAAEGVAAFVEKREPHFTMSVREDFPHDLVSDGT